jgi:hypothetical protein
MTYLSLPIELFYQCDDLFIYHYLSSCFATALDGELIIAMMDCMNLCFSGDDIAFMCIAGDTGGKILIPIKFVSSTADSIYKINIKQNGHFKLRIICMRIFLSEHGRIYFKVITV